MRGVGAHLQAYAAVLLGLACLAACDDYHVAQDVTLRQKPGVESAKCEELEAGDGVDCVGGKVDYGCSGYQDAMDGRWFSVIAGGTKCWARLDWLDDDGPLTAMNERIADTVSYATFAVQIAKALKAKTAKSYWNCSAAYGRAAAIKRHTKAKWAKEEGHKCELRALRETIQEEVLFEGHEEKRNQYKLYWKCRHYSSYLRRALNLERTSPQEAPDGHVARALTTCVAAFARTYIGHLARAAWSRKHLNAVKKELSRCDTDLASVSRRAFQAQLKKVLRRAAAQRRDPQKMTFEPAALRWSKTPDHLEVELRYASKHKFWQLDDNDRYWTLLTFCFRDGSWYVDRDNPYLMTW